MLCFFELYFFTMVLVHIKRFFLRNVSPVTLYFPSLLHSSEGKDFNWWRCISRSIFLKAKSLDVYPTNWGFNQRCCAAETK